MTSFFRAQSAAGHKQTGGAIGKTVRSDFFHGLYGDSRS